MANTLVVSLSYTSRHPLYKKIVKKNKKNLFRNTIFPPKRRHVIVRETAPLSRLKRFTTVQSSKRINHFIKILNLKL